MKKLGLILVIFVVGTTLLGCRKKVIVPPAPTISADDLYKQGLTAFNEGTPEGYSRASDLFRRAYRMAPTRCEFPLNLAQSLLFLAEEQQLNLEEFEPRRTEAKELVEATRGPCATSEAFLLRLDSLLLGRNNETSAMMRRATTIEPGNPVNWLVYSKVEILNRDNMIEQVLQTGGDSALALYSVAYYRGNRGSRTPARDLLRRAIQLSPRHFRAHLELAFALSVDDAVDDAAEVEPLYKKVVEIAPKFLEGRLAMGNYFGAIGQVDEAVGQFNAAIQANPKYDVAYFSIGLLMLRNERPREAEEAFLKVIELDTNQAEAFYYLGILALTRNELDTAKNRFQQALNTRINYYAAEYGLGRVLESQNDIDGALIRIDRAATRGNIADAYVSRAGIRANRNQRTDAISDLDTAIRLFDGQISIANAAIEGGRARPNSRAAQATARRAERDKERLQQSRSNAALYKSALEKTN